MVYGFSPTSHCQWTWFYCRITGLVRDPASGAWFILKFISLAQVIQAQYSLTVQNCALKYCSFHLKLVAVDTLGFLCSCFILFKTISYYGKINLLIWNYQSDSSLPGICVWTGDSFHSFISSHFHFLTHYVPHDTYVCNRDQCC